MFKQLLTNKKIIIAVIVVLLLLSVGIVILVTSSTKENSGENIGTKVEQSKEDANTKEKEDDNENSDSKLEILEPNEVTPENSSDVSGSWDNASESNEKAEQPNTTVKPNKEQEDDGKESANEEDILEDNINWGNIY